MRCVQCGGELVPATRGRPRRYCGRACQARAYRARRDGTTRSPGAARARRTAPPAELDRAGIVRAAIRLADAEGLDAVSMRALAVRNGVAATTLYRQVSGKDELVAAMVDAVVAEYQPPDPVPSGWRAHLEHHARQEWALYQRHPWVLRVLATTRPPLGRSVLATVDRSVTVLIGHGVDAGTGLLVYLLISGYVQGMALLTAAEAEAVRDNEVSYARWWSARHGELAGAIGSGRYPWLTALAAPSPPIDAADPAALDACFSFGLRRVLDGVAVLLAEHPSSPATPPPAR
ncbi:TetR/AcrR family transcriptional regulator [Goodfellowiella coeruleoviolacea]|uniref:Transcriptional regulator, TetR family n=1 Tax=Goodfellowiella coeruleoviolacea TaxID=334858 RepID=A0AAE3KEE5_9PSEU|nr:TetR/AcrR family transcriptional regulator [Goodfellowiella coeruleoviolacea]MCP2163279.1 transcriptional regulator, TetR family [Goodfellowiella coeruleoviolacea]